MGSAVLFYNMHEDGNSDRMTEHAGLPVPEGQGTKWVSNLCAHTPTPHVLLPFHPAWHAAPPHPLTLTLQHAVGQLHRGEPGRARARKEVRRASRGGSHRAVSPYTPVHAWPGRGVGPDIVLRQGGFPPLLAPRAAALDTWRQNKNASQFSSNISLFPVHARFCIALSFSAPRR